MVRIYPVRRARTCEGVGSGGRERCLEGTVPGLLLEDCRRDPRDLTFLHGEDGLWTDINTQLARAQGPTYRCDAQGILVVDILGSALVRRRADSLNRERQRHERARVRIRAAHAPSATLTLQPHNPSDLQVVLARLRRVLAEGLLEGGDVGRLMHADLREARADPVGEARGAERVRVVRRERARVERVLEVLQRERELQDVRLCAARCPSAA